uniref:MEGF10_11 n=1 Tax=Magallana gigas TaxID=29159 RepID=A0A8W8KI80_MAGGI|nr:uncharacterized protein LOC117692987 [Crassostrea gigas]
MLKLFVSLSGIAFILLIFIQSGCFVFCSDCNRNKNGCCVNYYRSRINGQCTECPAGTFGLNCSSICGDDYYGRLCKMECNCTDGQYCDPVHGCLNNHSDTTERESISKETKADHGIAKSLECKSDIGQCCQNYYKVNGNCTECPTGTFGLNCSATCPSNYHGVFCKEECHCTDGQYCDSINGCIQNATSDNLTVAANKHYTKEMETVAHNVKAALTTTPSFEDISVWENMTFAFIGSIATALAVTAIMCLKSRLKKNQRHEALRCQRGDHADPSAARQDQVEANIENINLVQEQANEETSDNMNDLYDDLRSSKMLDIYSNVTKKNNLATCSTKNVIPNRDHCNSNEFIIESVLMYSNSNEEINAKDESVPNYEQFQLPCQYSILSLKRNLDPSAAELYGKTEYNNADAYDLVNVYENSGSSYSSNSQSEMETRGTIIKTENEIDEHNDDAYSA